jgi:uncharacterized protein involved in type VI secretion and phage assembly
MRTGELYQRYHGLYVATVVDEDDPEKLGRVRLATDQYDDSEDDPIWAAVARPAGGKDTSVFFTPKVGDQVIIGYIVGDANEPIVIGYAHSKKLPKPSQVDVRKHGIVTNIGSVVFDEDAKKITVTFSAGSDSTITMDSDGISINTSAEVKIDGADNVTVNGGNQKVSRVDDSLNAGSLLTIGSGAVVEQVLYFPAGPIGDGLKELARQAAIQAGKVPTDVPMNAGLITSGADRFTA